MSKLVLSAFENRIAEGCFGSILTTEQTTIVLSFAIELLGDFRNWEGVSVNLTAAERDAIDEYVGQVSRELMPP